MAGLISLSNMTGKRIIILASLIIIISGSLYLKSYSKNRKSNLKEETDLQRQIYSLDIDFHQPCTYTVFRQKGSAPTRVVYYLHGAGGDHLTWLTSHRNIRDQWRRDEKEFPLVVAISLGKKWSLVKEKTISRTLPIEIFYNRVFPEIEKKLATTGIKIKERLAMGYSMGGYNSIQLLFKKRDYFSRVVLISPAILRISPYSSESEINSYVERNRPYLTTLKYSIYRKITGKDKVRDRLMVMPGILKKMFKSHQSWEKISYQRLLEKSRGKKLPDIYVTSGQEDELGLFDSSQDFATKLIKLKEEKAITIDRVIWKPVKGKHYNVKIDVKSVADFLTE